MSTPSSSWARTVGLAWDIAEKGCAPVISMVLGVSKLLPAGRSVVGRIRFVGRGLRARRSNVGLLSRSVGNVDRGLMEYVCGEQCAPGRRELLRGASQAFRKMACVGSSRSGSAATGCRAWGRSVQSGCERLRHWVQA